MVAILKSDEIEPHSTRAADALFSRTQQRVLSLLIAQPQRRLFASELIQMAACGSGTVQRELARLVECGLLTTQIVGKQRFYQANTSSPLYPPLHALLKAMQSPWLALQQQLNTLGERIDFAGLTPIQAEQRGPTSGRQDGDAATALPRWQLLVIAHDLRLADLYPRCQATEITRQIHIDVVLYQRADWQALTSQQPHRARQLLENCQTRLVTRLSAA